jgi:hypothetical protein
MGHRSPAEDALHARTRLDKACFILNTSESFSSITSAFAPRSLSSPDMPFFHQVSVIR